MTVLKKCPCGEVPDFLHVTGAMRGHEYLATAQCCNKWHVTFVDKTPQFRSLDLFDQADEAWNAAPRGDV